MNEKHVIVNGVRTRYLECGRGLPLLMISGGNFGEQYSANDWDTNIDHLGRHFHVYSIDKIGCGFTDNPRSDEGYLIGSTVRHAYDFLTTLGIDRCAMMGHSRGGYTATRLALEHPEMALALVIVSSSTLMTPPNPLYDQWDRESEKLKNLRERERFLIVVNSYSEAHITDAFLDNIVKIMEQAKVKEAQSKVSSMRARFKEDLVARQNETHEWIRAGKLRSIPTLVIWGYNDPSATMERCGIPCMNLILPSVPKSEMHVLNHAGHYCFREQPEAFDAAVIDFMGRHLKDSKE